MKAQSDCFACLKRQVCAHPVAIEEYQSFLQSIPKDQNGASIALSPPQIAIGLYEKIARDLGVSDPFAHIKAQSIQKASQILQMLDLEVLSLEEALRLSALGNVIDYGSASQFCIQDFDFMQELSRMDFACFDFDRFQDALEGARSLVMLGDNAGENLFDEVLLRVLSRQYPSLELFYFVRGKPIINDITLLDLQRFEECKGIFEVAQVVDSGVKSPGFVYDDANTEAQQIFSRSDLVLSKGMGNFECLDERKDSRIFYLLKIKCQVVANRLGFALGKMVFRQNHFVL